MRAGGRDFFCASLDAAALIERLEELTDTVQCDPYKVLIVDDSRAQATFTERTLNGAEDQSPAPSPTRSARWPNSTTSSPT